jgi:TonB family protein
MTLTVSNLAAYSIQLAVLVAVALIATRLVRLRTPRPLLRFWQSAVAVSLLLPFAGWQAESAGRLLESPATFVAASTPVTALTGRGVDVTQWLLLAIAAGITARLLWLGLGFVRLRAIIAHAVPAPSLDAMAAELSASLAARASLAVTDEIGTPATVGVRRAIVLLPRHVLDLPPAVQRAVIAHELVHVRRRDWLHTIAEECWCAVLWFHPAARIVTLRLSLARETVVDEITIRATRDRRAYAEALLAFSNPQPHVPAITPLIGRHSLSQRIALIAEEEVMSRYRTLASAALAFTLSGAAVTAAVTAFPLTAPAQTTKVYKPGDGVTLPTVTREVKPSYTPEAMQRKIQGSVWLEAVVLETGDVGDIQVTRSLDPEYGLDREAIKAAKQWKFKPGTKDGKPVAVVVTIELTFTLKK